MIKCKQCNAHSHGEVTCPSCQNDLVTQSVEAKAKNKQQALIDATNLLCEHVANNLPDGWSIVLEMQRGDCSLSLIDDQGDEIEVDSPGSDRSKVDAMCQAATGIDFEEAMDEAEDVDRQNYPV